MEALVNALSKYFESVSIRSKQHKGHLCLRPEDFQAAIDILIYSLSQFRLVVTPNMNRPLDGVIRELKLLSTDAASSIEYPYDEDLLEEITELLQPCEDSFHTGQYDMIAGLFLIKITARTLPTLAKKRQTAFHTEMKSSLWEFFEHDDQLTQITLANNHNQTNPTISFVKNNRPFLTAIFSQTADDWWQQVPSVIKENMTQCTRAFRNFADIVNNNVHLKKRTPLFFNNTAIYNSPNPALTSTTFESALCEALIGEGIKLHHRMFLRFEPDEFAAFTILCYRFPYVEHLFTSNLAILNEAAQDWVNFENAKNSRKRLHERSDYEDYEHIAPLTKKSFPGQ